MARHKLTDEEKKEGMLKSIHSDKTPKRLREGLKKYALKIGLHSDDEG